MNINRLGAWLLLLVAGTAQAAPPPQAAKPEPGASLYAVNAASIATAMTYCMSKHGPLRVGSRAETCFREARNLLAGYGLKAHAERIDQLCRDPAQFNTCITPEIGKLVIALNTQLQERLP